MRVSSGASARADMARDVKVRAESARIIVLYSAMVSLGSTFGRHFYLNFNTMPRRYGELACRTSWVSAMKSCVCYLLALVAAANAFTASRSALPARACRAAAPALSMRYGKKQVKIRQKLNRMILDANTIEDVAAVLQHPFLAASSRRMMKHLVLKARRKAMLMGYQIGYLDDDEEDLLDEMVEFDVDSDVLEVDDDDEA